LPVTTGNRGERSLRLKGGGRGKESKRDLNAVGGKHQLKEPVQQAL